MPFCILLRCRAPPGLLVHVITSRHNATQRNAIGWHVGNRYLRVIPAKKGILSLTDQIKRKAFPAAKKNTSFILYVTARARERGIAYFIGRLQEELYLRRSHTAAILLRARSKGGKVKPCALA